MLAHIIEVANPYEPLKDSARHEITHEIKLGKWLAGRFGVKKFDEFPRATLILINGKPLLRKGPKNAGWRQYKIQHDDIINIVTLPGYIVVWFLVVAIVAAAVTVLATSKTNPALTNQTPASDPYYTLKGQSNQIKLGQPIEVPYGRTRRWPSYAAQPYNQYVNNDQWLFQLFCLGQGQQEINEINIGDTGIANYLDVYWEDVPPGGDVTLFPTQVITSVDVEGLELLGTNQTGYGWLGPYDVCPPGTTTTHIETDLVLASGLYHANNSGGLDTVEISAKFQYRRVDDGDNPLTDWMDFGWDGIIGDWDVTLSTVNAQRITLSCATLPIAGRYQIRGQRTTDKASDAQTADKLTWDAVRAFLPNVTNYGNVHMLAVKARASNNLNSNSSSQINVVSTRMLPIYDPESETWSALTATRSLVWAYCDIFRSNYGARLADQFLNLTNLVNLNDTLIERGDFFDYCYDQSTTVWDAGKLLGQAARSVPTIVGSQVDLVRDAAQTVPVAAFGPENIIKETFQYQIKLPGYDYYDGLEVTYTDPTTFQPATVLCCLDDEEGDNPMQVSIPQITQLQQAYNEGMYQRAVMRMLNENIQFSTGLEGHLPTYGDLCRISYDIPKWSQSGLVTKVTGPVSSGGSLVTKTLTLNNAVKFYAGVTNYLMIRYKDGTQKGPWTATVGTDAKHVVLQSISDYPEDMPMDNISEYPLFFFGKGTDLGYIGRMVGGTPGTDKTVQLNFTNYTTAIYAKDGYTPPDPGNPHGSLPPIPDIPTVTGLIVSPSPNIANQVTASWDPDPGAAYYYVELSYDGETWTSVYSDVGTTCTFPVLPKYIYVRVSGINNGQSAYDYWFGDAPSVAPPAPSGLTAAPGTGKSVILKWNYTLVQNVLMWKVYRNTVNNFSTATNIGQTNASTYVDGPVALGTTYFYWVTAFNTAEGPPSVYATVVTNVGPVDPDTPSAPSPGGCTTGATVDGTGNVLGYIDVTLLSSSFPPGAASLCVKFKPHAAGSTAWQTADTPTQPCVTRISDLSANTAYDVAICSNDAYFNQSALVLCSPSPITTSANANTPNAPTSLVAATNQGAQVGLSWVKNSETDIQFYTVWRNTSNNFSTATNIGIAYATSFNDIGQVGGLTNYTTYFYWVTATNSSTHTSNQSNGSSATPTQSSLLNAVAPSDPSAPTLADAGGVQQATDGTITGFFDVSVAGKPAGSVYQKLAFKLHTASNWLIADGFMVNTSTQTIQILGLISGAAYDLGVTAFNEDGKANASGYITLVSQIAPSKTNAPNTPTFGSLSNSPVPLKDSIMSSGFDWGTFLQWTGVTDKDLTGYICKVTTTNSSTATDYIYGGSNFYGEVAIPAQPGALPYSQSMYNRNVSPSTGYAWVCAINASGVRSGWLFLGAVNTGVIGIGTGTMSSQETGATSGTGSAFTNAAIGDMSQSSVQSRQTNFAPAAFNGGSLTGGGTAGTITMSVANRGFKVIPSSGVFTCDNVGIRYTYNPYRGSQTTSNLIIDVQCEPGSGTTFAGQNPLLNAVFAA